MPICKKCTLRTCITQLDFKFGHMIKGALFLSHDVTCFPCNITTTYFFIHVGMNYTRVMYLTVRHNYNKARCLKHDNSAILNFSLKRAVFSLCISSREGSLYNTFCTNFKKKQQLCVIWQLVTALKYCKIIYYKSHVRRIFCVRSIKSLFLWYY